MFYKWLKVKKKNRTIERRSSIWGLHRRHHRRRGLVSRTFPSRIETALRKKYLSRDVHPPLLDVVASKMEHRSFFSPLRVPPVCINVDDRCRLIAGIVVGFRAIGFPKIKASKNHKKKRKKKGKEIRSLCCFWKLKIPCVFVINPLIGNIFQFRWSTLYRMKVSRIIWIVGRVVLLANVLSVVRVQFVFSELVFVSRYLCKCKVTFFHADNEPPSYSFVLFLFFSLSLSFSLWKRCIGMDCNIRYEIWLLLPCKNVKFCN